MIKILIMISHARSKIIYVIKLSQRWPHHKHSSPQPAWSSGFLVGPLLQLISEPSFRLLRLVLVLQPA